MAGRYGVSVVVSHPSYLTPIREFYRNDEKDW
jgi:hypothetical protein